MATGEQLAWPVHEIHGTHSHGATIELLLNEAEDGVWHFRRDRRIARSLARVGLTTATGILFLAPEVVLLYKAQEGRDTDAADFAIVREVPGGDQTVWLGQAIRIAYGAHPWLQLISRGDHSFSVETATSD